jgi:hypothetical protein
MNQLKLAIYIYMLAFLIGIWLPIEWYFFIAPWVVVAAVVWIVGDLIYSFYIKGPPMHTPHKPR